MFNKPEPNPALVQERLERLRGKVIDFRLRPPTGPYRTFFTPNVVGAVNRLLGHPVPRSYAISTEPYPHSEDRAIAALHRAHHRGQALDVDGVHDAGAGREHAEATDGVGRPLHEAVPFGVPLHLPLHVALQRIRPGGHVHRQRMVGRGRDRHGGRSGSGARDRSSSSKGHLATWMPGYSPSMMVVKT